MKVACLSFIHQQEGRGEMLHLGEVIVHDNLTEVLLRNNAGASFDGYVRCALLSIL